MSGDRLTYLAPKVSTKRSQRRQRFLDLNTSVMQGKPANLLVDNNGYFSTPNLDADIQFTVQIERCVSTIDVETVLWHI